MSSYQYWSHPEQDSPSDSAADEPFRYQSILIRLLCLSSPHYSISHPFQMLHLYLLILGTPQTTGGNILHYSHMNFAVILNSLNIVVIFQILIRYPLQLHYIPLYSVLTFPLQLLVRIQLLLLPYTTVCCTTDKSYDWYRIHPALSGWLPTFFGWEILFGWCCHSVGLGWSTL